MKQIIGTIKSAICAVRTLLGRLLRAPTSHQLALQPTPIHRKR